MESKREWERGERKGGERQSDTGREGGRKRRGEGIGKQGERGEGREEKVRGRNGRKDREREKGGGGHVLVMPSGKKKKLSTWFS